MTISAKKISCLACLVAFSLVSTNHYALAAPEVIRPVELNQLISEATSNNLGLQAVAARVAALKKKISAAGALEDPKMGFGLANMPTDSFDFDQEPMTQKQVFVSQKIPWFGKRTLMIQISELKAAKEAVVLKKQKLELTRRVSDMFYRLWYVDRALENNRRLKEMLEQVLEVTRTGYASGKALEKDLIQARLEISRLENQRIALQTDRRSLDRDINGLLNRNVFQSIQTPKRLAEPETAIDIEALKQSVLGSNPQIRIKEIDLQMAELESELADKNFWPDSEWRLTYGQRDRVMNQEMADFLSASVMFNVPMWQNKRQGPILAAKQEMADSTRMELKNLLSTLSYEAESVAGEITDLVKNYHFFKNVIIPQAGQLARSSMSSYQVGKLVFDTMIRARIRQLEVELKADKYLQIIYSKQAELDALVGNPVTDLTDLEGDKP